MAERIVSPGVFTRERDLSFLPVGVGAIGAAIIGPTAKGPAFVPTLLNSFDEFTTEFGEPDDKFYTPLTIQKYFQGGAGAVTVVRVLGIGGYTNDYIALGVSGSNGNQYTLAILKPSRGGVEGTQTLQGSASLSGSNAGDNTWSNTNLEITSSTHGAQVINFSFDSGSSNFIEDVFGSVNNAQAQTLANGAGTPVYIYKSYARTMRDLELLDGSGSFASTGEDNFSQDYAQAATPFITSQKISGGTANLFKVKTRSHGTNVNDDFKIQISNIKPAADVPGSDYGTFSLNVLVNNPGQNNDGDLIEGFNNLSLDSDAPNYFVKEIGDQDITIDSNGKLTVNGDYPNKSKNIYISNINNGILERSLSPELVPFGFGKVSLPNANVDNVPTASFKSGQLDARNEFDSGKAYGFDFDHDDSKEYLAPIPTGGGSGNNVTMSLGDFFGHADASSLGATFANGSTLISLTNSHIQQRKFNVPLQGGFDGDNPAVPKKLGSDISATNQQGFDCSTNTASGSVAYKRAINAISNPDEFDVNLVVTPGIIYEYHPQVGNHAISKVEARGDCFYITNGSRVARTVDNAVLDIKSLDTNYAAVYYPWVKLTGAKKSLFVPPDVVIPGVLANNDSVAAEWFAPAGLNRGLLTELGVTMAQTRLTHSERDDLYEGRVNPIASFPAQGVVVFGQKTLQSKPSALDRINVRRLLINLKKFIASSSRYLVFEQNTAATRNRFLNIVNPFLESVQANSGLSAFKVVMDDSNNTPDVVDRNQLVGQIFIQPTRTAEFIVLDFVVLPTGAAFPE